VFAAIHLKEQDFISTHNVHSSWYT